MRTDESSVEVVSGSHKSPTPLQIVFSLWPTSTDVHEYMANSYFRISSVEVGKHKSTQFSLLQEPDIEEQFWKTTWFVLGWRES